MRTKAFLIISLISLIFSETIKLPAPDMQGGMPINEALLKRKSERDYHDIDMTDQEISQVLWAGYGPNRPDGKKTTPSWCGNYPFDIYVFLKKGTYLYKADENELELIKSGDSRPISGENEFVKDASMDLCFIGFYEREDEPQTMDEKEHAMNLDAGIISENLYLASASLGLQAVVRGNFVPQKIIDAFGLPAEKVYIPLCFSVSK